MTELRLRVGETYRHKHERYGLSKIISAEYKIFDQSSSEEDSEKEVVFIDETGCGYRADGSHSWINGANLIEQTTSHTTIDDDGPYFRLEVGKVYEHDENSPDVRIVKEWMTDLTEKGVHLYLGDNGHVYWGSGFSALLTDPHIYRLTKESG